MTQKVVRIRISEVVFKKYKLLCVEKDLSIPKQTTQLIRKFVEIDEENKRLMKDMRKE
jgi:hypothetical protein